MHRSYYTSMIVLTFALASCYADHQDLPDLSTTEGQCDAAGDDISACCELQEQGTPCHLLGGRCYDPEPCSSAADCPRNRDCAFVGGGVCGCPGACDLGYYSLHLCVATERCVSDEIHCQGETE